MKYLAAGSGVEGLFWLVMAVIWVVVQIVSRAAKKQMRRGAPPRPTTSSPAQPDTSLADFLRSLGADPVLPPRPVAEPEPPRIVYTESAPPARTRKHKKSPPLAPMLPAVTPAPAGAEPAGESWRKAPPPERDVAHAGQRIRWMMVIPKIPVVNLQGLRVPGLAFHGDTISNLRPGPDHFPLKGRAALRQAMLHRLILEPPHVFQV